MTVLFVLLLAVSADLSTADRLYRSGEFEPAAAEYRQLLQTRPDDVRSLVGFGKTLLALHRVQEAASYLSRAMRLNPGDRDARREMGHAYQMANRLEQGEMLLKDLTASDPKDAESWFYRGALMYQNGYYQAALDYLNRSLALRPSNDEAKIERAVCLMRLGRTADAEVASKAALANPATGANLDLLLSYAEVLYETGRLKDAMEQVDHALRVAPRNAMAHFWRSRILLQRNQLAPAAAEGEQAVQLAPQLSYPRNLLIKIYTLQGRSQDAARQAEWLREYTDKRAKRER